MNDITRNDVHVLMRAIIAGALIQSKTVDISGVSWQDAQAAAPAYSVQQLKKAIDAVMSSAVLGI